MIPLQIHVTVFDLYLCLTLIVLGIEIGKVNRGSASNQLGVSLGVHTHPRLSPWFLYYSNYTEILCLSVYW